MLKNLNNKSKRKKLRVIPISGLEFIGANCTAIEYGDDIVIIDAGMGFTSVDYLGIDYVIPNPKYFVQNAKKIKGLVITHGHLDHIGAIPNLIESMGFPTIFASKFAKELIYNKVRMDAKDVYPKVNITNVNPNSKLRFGDIQIEFFSVNHSIPESMGIIIRTPEGIVVHSGDFKFDNSPINEAPADYAKIAKVGSEGVLCLLSDSTNSYREGNCLSESEISKRLDGLIGDIKGRVVVATFGSMVNRLMELLKIAQKYDRKVFVSGRSMQNAIDIAVKVGYIKIPENLLIKGRDVSKYKDDKIMILATGSQGEDLAALARMSRNEHKEIQIKHGDTVILSASIIPGNGSLVQGLIDDLSKLGAYVYHNEIMNLHTTGHGHKEEQKLMINLVQPKYFMPVHGFQSFLAEHARTAVSIGIPEENVILAKDGDVIELSKQEWKKVSKVTAKPVNVSGSMVGDIGNIVLDDRQKLASYGVVVYSMLLNKQTGEFVKSPEILSRGFVYMKTSKELINGASALIEEEYKVVKDKKMQPGDLKEYISKRLRKYFYKETQREPILLAVIEYL